MCYSAQVQAEFKAFQRAFGAVMDINAYVKTFWWDQGKDPRRVKAPRAMVRELLEIGPPELQENLRAADAAEADILTREIFDQKRRVGDAERALQLRETKKAREDVRIGTNKVQQAQRRLDTLKGARGQDDSRIFPGVYCPVLVVENGQRVVKPMRYQCRPSGTPAMYDRKFPGTYNARRDNLEGFWRRQFGYTHGLMVADRFYENVEGPDGQNQRIEFVPRTGEPMLVACLWSHWRDPAGIEPELLSFAAITDEPEPEVAAAGHDRTIINIKPEHIGAWLNPDPRNLGALYAIFDDKRHPFYEHRLAA
ncbi:SOS response-associated peptidase family protein [Xanthomonas campestris pv. plantaginis]|uniref:SOS response-associated peptidase family protein n=1 Tax=Xanthomonas campestris TaxID=339 RepID=UPI002B224E83|nr:SOS response-associated peptidase family protein [Xanthomonas campestris]MEA9605689.1 SOS response-associated peptidase family protein [Xanthomonas campestris pv. plantaginis]